jgi:uncharacterized protein YbaA (DUF1428 family)
MRYVDGYILAVPKKNLAAYRKMAAMGGKIWRKHGALDYKECVSEDMYPKEVTFPFPKAMKLKPDELVIFSYIVFKSRAHRDAVNAKVMKDASMNNPQYKDKPMPFDMKRMVYGGFDVIVDA